MDVQRRPRGRLDCPDCLGPLEESGECRDCEFTHRHRRNRRGTSRNRLLLQERKRRLDIAEQLRQRMTDRVVTAINNDNHSSDNNKRRGGRPDTPDPRPRKRHHTAATNNPNDKNQRIHVQSLQQTKDDAEKSTESTAAAAAAAAAATNNSNSDSEKNEKKSHKNDSDNDDAVEVIAVNSLDVVLQRRIQQAEAKGEVVNLVDLPDEKEIPLKIIQDHAGHDVICLDSDDDDDDGDH